jgi:hypothetical protein
MKIESDEKKHAPIEENSRFKLIMGELKPLLPLLLSHHPPCETFSSHTLNFGKAHLCIGCFIGTPSAFVGLFLGKLLLDSYTVKPLLFYIIGLFLYLAQLLSLTKFTQIKKIKIIQKMSIGFGSGLMLSPLYYNLEQSSSSWVDRFLLVLIILLLFIPIGLLHMRTTKKTCVNCEHKFQENICPEEWCLAEFNPIEPISEKIIGEISTIINESYKK